MTGLDESVLPFLNKVVRVVPIYGYGWSRVDRGESMEVPDEFLMQIVRFTESNGERFGGVGRIESLTHEMNGLWVFFQVRHVGQWNFTLRPDYYTLEMGSIDPKDWPGGKKRVSAILYSGYASIVAEKH